MAQTPAKVDLSAPFTSDVVLEVRMGKMKPMRGLTIESGIEKGLCSGPVKVDTMGIEGDEHDYTFHGGPEKAIHGYCMAHYEQWRQEFPEAADSFVPGAFGENLVTAHMNERNVCIGDVYSVGSGGLVLQVSLPRQPCFKLNHRFQLKNFAPNTWRLSRTGWYYRVLHPGTVEAGDTITLVERKHPKWTIERIQEYLHRNRNDVAMNAELAAIEELGGESRNDFKARAAKAQREALREQQKGARWREFRVVEKKQQTPRVMSFILEATQPLPEEDEVDLDPGSHAKVKLGNGLVRAYSIVDGNKNRFQLGIALEESGKGGSKYMHTQVEVGHVVEVGATTAAVPIASAASHHVFVAAGIGLTAFLSIVEAYKSINYSATLHYAARSQDEIPFKERVDALGKEYVVVYDKTAGQRLDVGELVKTRPWNSQLYFCGPRRLMDEAATAVKIHGVPQTEVHFEAFETDISGDPFQVVVANREGYGDGKVLEVGEEQTLLEILQKEFGEHDIPSSCSVGNCGTCKISLKSGRVDHRGTALTDEDKATSMLSCVSRGIGRIAIEI